MSRSQILISALAVVGMPVAVYFLLLVVTPSFDYHSGAAKITDTELIAEEPSSPQAYVPTHIETPDIVRAVYMTSWSAGVRDEGGNYYWRDDILKLIADTELNAIVIDIKDATGRVSFNTEESSYPLLREINPGTERIPEIRQFIKEIHDQGVYVIGRLSVFQDPHLVGLQPELAVRRLDNAGVWKDYKGLSWIDPGATDSWDYIIELALESYGHGFDEINFDYIRFPSDGDMENVSYTHYDPLYPKRIQMKEFFVHLRNELTPLGIPISADLFGMTTTNRDDLSIGQVLEDALLNFDFVAPMVYPSHYPWGFNGLGNPNESPYEVVHFSMSEAVKRAEAASTTRHKLRPWLQDFDYGGNYDEAKIRAQKEAVYDAGLYSWMLWDPKVKYTRGAFD